MDDKEELEYAFEYGITVAELIKRLERLPQDLVVINSCKQSMPISDVSKTNVDYCFDEIISKEVVSIY